MAAMKPPLLPLFVFDQQSRSFIREGTVNRIDPDVRQKLNDVSVCIQSDFQRRAIDALPVCSSDKILEIGAAPGGKSAHLALKLGDSGALYALDRNAHKLKHLKNRMLKLGLSDKVTVISDDVVTCDLSQYNGGIFDAIVIDVPCSNTAEFLRRVELRWRLSLDYINQLVEIQKKIVKKTVDYLKPGGYLNYMTCSVLTAENEDMRDFCLSLGQFEMVLEHKHIPDPDAPYGGYAVLLRKT